MELGSAQVQLLFFSIHYMGKMTPGCGFPLGSGAWYRWDKIQTQYSENYLEHHSTAHTPPS